MKNMKGVAGKNTGSKARAAIRKAQSAGATLKSIGVATNRSASTISQIASGEIKNPPKTLVSKISKAKKSK